MKGSEIRQAFLDYFRSQGHTVVPSSSLVPHEDPTILFTNAGMNQFKDTFLGAEKRSYTRAATAQKCVRISGKHNDFENVGVTARHHTFFEMLGNFSFGDYFKADAIKYAWELSTKVFGLPKSRIWVSVFREDDEAAELWRTTTDISSDRIVRMDEKDNFWAMGDTGPCGPCSELYFYVGPNDRQQSEADFRRDDGSYLEFWNLVFMQFERDQSGKLNPLPRPSIDTGMGLERMAAILQNRPGNYETDLVRDVISLCEELSGIKYQVGSYAIKSLKEDREYAQNVAMRVIADHSRAAAFLIADGVIPGSEGRNYALRRILRRAIRHGRALNFNEPFLGSTTARVVQNFGEQYPELLSAKDTIRAIVEAEELKFRETLDAGLSILTKQVEKLSPGENFPGETAFLLHDTYGFPLDLTEDALKTWSCAVDTEGYTRAMEEQRARSREERRSQNIVFATFKSDAPKTEFLGYSATRAEAKLVDVLHFEGQKASLLFDATPFYAESGGQVGDTGFVELDGVKLRVVDTRKAQDHYYVHECEVIEGSFSPALKGRSALLQVDEERRQAIEKNHSSTHLLHSALRSVLGTHVKQAGSRVDDHSLRFDFSHFEAITDAQLEEITRFVNSYIQEDHEVRTQLMPVEAAKASGAMALFGEKYGDVVRVVEIGPKSMELCGGTHVKRTGNIGPFIVLSEGGVSSGVRRIECVSGAGAEREIKKLFNEREQLAALLKGDKQDVVGKVERLLGRIKQLEKEVDGLKSKLGSFHVDALLEGVRTTKSGVRIVVARVEASDQDSLKEMVDKLRVKLGTGVVALGAPQGDTSIVVAGATADLQGKVHVGNALKEAFKHFNGRGGGRADFAQGGGVAPAQIDGMLEAFFKLLE